ncbi:MAG: hypothetical protein ACRD2W_00010 [Acidimicrobiales bacterium]
MQSSHSLDRLSVTFDDPHAVADAGLVLPATLAQHLGLRQLLDDHVDLGTAPGHANWTSRTGLGETLIATDTLRRRYLRVPGRLTCSARRLTLHLPQSWPWSGRFDTALANLRAVKLVT